MLKLFTANINTEFLFLWKSNLVLHKLSQQFTDLFNFSLEIQKKEKLWILQK